MPQKTHMKIRSRKAAMNKKCGQRPCPALHHVSLCGLGLQNGKGLGWQGPAEQQKRGMTEEWDTATLSFFHTCSLTTCLNSAEISASSCQNPPSSSSPKVVKNDNMLFVDTLKSDISNYLETEHRRKEETPVERFAS